MNYKLSTVNIRRFINTKRKEISITNNNTDMQWFGTGHII